MKERVADVSQAGTVFRIICNPRLRKAAARCVKTIFYHFFYLQFKAAFLPGRVPVTQADHPLDREIPFKPRWVGVYLDFVSSWVRMTGFLLERFGRKAEAPALDFIETMGQLYVLASEIYRKNLSTTMRPRYYKRPRFLLIHAADPHLMCIPSLHVIVVIRTYTKFRAILRDMGEDAALASQIAEVRQLALDITEAILYVKQHSVNCIPAAMYFMTRFDPWLFGAEEAEDFVSAIFTRPLSPEESPAIRAYIVSRYRQFLAEGGNCGDWREPLLKFLREYQLTGVQVTDVQEKYGG
ncbi:MAG: hypothetical protein LBL20_00285 [Treponema sp.]|nr:hypothetical protein [Treponema sp.]